jgi:hypothetical protein
VTELDDRRGERRRRRGHRDFDRPGLGDDRLHGLTHERLGRLAPLSQESGYDGNWKLAGHQVHQVPDAPTAIAILVFTGFRVLGQLGRIESLDQSLERLGQAAVVSTLGEGLDQLQPLALAFVEQPLVEDRAQGLQGLRLLGSSQVSHCVPSRVDAQVGPQGDLADRPDERRIECCVADVHRVAATDPLQEYVPHCALVVQIRKMGEHQVSELPTGFRLQDFSEIVHHQRTLGGAEQPNDDFGRFDGTS